MKTKHIALWGVLLLMGTVQGQQWSLEADYKAIEPKVIEWRRDIHQHPELSNCEFKTAEKIAAQ
mgnify:FL=1